MNAGVVGFLLPAVGALALFGGHAAADPPQQDDLGTGYAKGVREVVPPEQRETLGLDETPWTKEHGKVHSRVYKALEKDERPWPRPVGYEGTVYVQVQLKHEQKGKADSAENKAAIKQLQSRVLSQLTAAEFHVEYPLQMLPGILGYVNRAGLEKLKTNPDVVAICLDDKPFPRRPQHVFKVDLPPLKPGDPATQAGGGGKVEVEVYQALGLHERVFVLVNLVPTGSHDRLSEEHMARVKEIENRVLSALTADEFWLSSKTKSFTALHGRVNKEGLKKLENHPDVDGVGMEDAPIRVPRTFRKRP
jgi:hypothetical protein